MTPDPPSTQRGIKAFSPNATNEEVIAFCTSPEAFITVGIIIQNNHLIDGEAFLAMKRCWWLKRLDLSGCEKLTGTSCGEGARISHCGPKATFAITLPCRHTYVLTR